MVDFPPFCARETFVTSCLLSCTPSFWKLVYCKRKEFASYGSNFFPFIVDPFQEDAKDFDLSLIKRFRLEDISETEWSK